MRLDLNWTQRGILVVAGLLFLLFAVGELDGFEPDKWLATTLFAAAVASFILAATSRAKRDAG